jgi:hypothetical protein
MMNQWTEHAMGVRLDELRQDGDAWAARRKGLDLRALLAGPPPGGPVEPAEAPRDEDEAFSRLINPEKVRRAQSFFETFGLQIGAALLHRSLPESYAAGRGVQVLYLTGELVSSPERRIRQTMQFILDVMTPDPNISQKDPSKTTTLHPGQRGAEAARRMRLFHQAVRHFIADSGRWGDREKYFEGLQPDGPPLGRPLNQEDLLGTLLEFSVGVFESLDRLGVPYTADDKIAWLHVWDVISRYMGIGTASAFRSLGSTTTIAPEMKPFLPLDAVHSHEVLAVIKRRNLVETFEGKVLVNVLLSVLQHPLSRGLKPLPASLMRYLLGSDTSDMLGITRGGWFQEWLLSAETLPRLAKAVTSGRTGGPVRAATGELSSFMTYQLLQSYIDDAEAKRPFSVEPMLQRSRGLNRPMSFLRPRP